jgi:ribosomal protein S18 acetylase RimI-like enzyme
MEGQENGVNVPKEDDSGSVAVARPSSAKMAPLVRVLARDELKLAAIALGKAFRDDPFMEFVMSDALDGLAEPLRGDLKECKCRDLFNSLLTLAFEYGACYVTSDYQSCTIWRPPGQGLLPFTSYVSQGATMLSVFGLTGSWKAIWTMDEIEKRHQQQPKQHWYLQTIGTAPDFQGKGYARALMLKHLALIDQAGLPAYLEATKEDNVKIYEKFGFRVVEGGVIKFSDTCTVYCMARPPSKQEPSHQ